jgi:hypothetical protein
MGIIWEWNHGENIDGGPKKRQWGDSRRPGMGNLI